MGMKYDNAKAEKSFYRVAHLIMYSKKNRVRKKNRARWAKVNENLPIWR